jgi:TetR/AcrR family transcriptional regulator
MLGSPTDTPEEGQPKRRAARDPRTTRLRILKVATQEFSGKGFDGARVDRIAARARLSKNMLYYYFGSKEDLFVAVLEAAYEKLRKRQANISVDSGDPVQSLRQLIHHNFVAFRDHPEVIRLLNQENLYKGQHIRRSQKIPELYDPLLSNLQAVLQQGVDQGIFRKDVDAKFVYLSLSSLSYHYFSNQYTLEFALQVALTSQEWQERWLQHITEMMIAACRVPVDGSPQSRGG